MVGRMAVAAASSDGDVQPYKKRKEDEPSMKAITTYFSPLGKNVDSVLSPPKSNNIMDYLKRASPTNEKIVSPELEKESKTNCSSLESSLKTLSRLKRRGKRCNLSNQLKDMKTPEHKLMVKVNSSDSTKMPSQKEEEFRISSIGHSVPALLSPTDLKELSNACNKNPLNPVSCKNEEGKTNIQDGNKKNVNRSKKRKHKDEMDMPECFSTETQQKGQCKEVDVKQVASSNESDNKSLGSVLGSETNPHETSYLNGSTVTISFEDFLKSQGEYKVDNIPKARTSDSSIVSDETMSCENQQLPLKKVTVLAQIHSVPPKSPSSRKIASIFLKQKNKEAKRCSILSTSELEYIEHMSQNRKSNVVIAEEELELAVLDTASSETTKSKCTAEERYQFMKAFKQPESETVKNGTKKGAGKIKEVGENSSELKLEMEEYEDVYNKKNIEASTDYAGNDFHSNMGKSDSTRIRNKLKRKVILETKENDLNTNENQNCNANGEIKEITSSERQSISPQKNNGLRRSSRQKKSQDSITSIAEKARISGAVAENTPGAILLQASTPRAINTAFNKTDLYKAEVITEPSDSKSPIRMKFIRISTAEGFSQESVKISSTSNSIFKAKKLVEKAKVLQHHRATRIAEELLRTPLRRSSRQQALVERKKRQNLEDSVIILDSSTNNNTTVLGSMNKKKLLSLNDVLGKKTGNLKTTKKSDGKENVSSFIRKNDQKPTVEAITISEESSEDDSENSQDVKQFKAKRDFLMSGLPETLKRQIAKQAAALEAYSATNSCFQTVVHIQQKDYGCLMWRLAPPSCPLLTNLREVNSTVTDVAKLTFSLGEFSVLNTQPNSTDSTIVVPSGWRPVFSEIQRNCLLEEIQSSNPHFPVKQFFDLLLKKQAAPENNKQVKKCDTSSSETNEQVVNLKETKRKRKYDDQKSKRKRQMEAQTELPDKSCIKQTFKENKIQTHNTDRTEKSGIITIEDSEFGSEISSTSDFEKEDMLWTEKYQPQNSSELIGNTVAVKKLHRWLCEWKRRADWEENRTLTGEKSSSQQEFSDSLDFKDDKSDSEEEAVLCNTMLLVGPPGIGKTAAVYACAQELGFKVFEVNASCQRSGRQILSQLKEATQSHQVDKQSIHSHKPCFFNNYISTKSPKKNSPGKEWSPRKSPVSPRKVGLKQGLESKTLAHYFKISSKSKNKEEKVQGSNKENKQSLSGEKIQINSIKRAMKEEESSKKYATSLILFEEVDIIFDEDVGFLNAIKTFMTTTKRPVILTTNDPSFSLIFDGYFEEITFSAPSLMNVASYLQVLCLTENLRMDIRDSVALLSTNNCDIRQSILHLQFWVRSGGGYLKEKGEWEEVSGTPPVTCVEEPTSSEMSKLGPANIPKHETGCIENLLGLKNIFLPSEDLFSFLKHEITTKEEWSKLTHLLTEFQMKNIDFIYSNLEILLPLPINIIPEPMQKNNLTHTLAENSSNNKLINSDCLEQSNSVKKSKQTKHQRKMVLLDDSDLFESELDYSGFITMPSDMPSSCLEEKKDKVEPVSSSTVTPSSGTSVKATGSASAFQCLNSLTEFVDNMSFLDCCFNRRTPESKLSCKYEEFVWTKGKIKNGLLDEFSAEHANWWNSQSCSELKATVEALNFKKCFKNISQMMERYLNSDRTVGKDEYEELTLHVSKDRANLYFGQSAANSSVQHNAQKRLEIIKTVFSNRTSLNISNTQASTLEYLPILRSICKSEKQKQQGKTKRRFLHYLEGIHLPKEILNSLASDFP
ncbi:ATPase family AAA domain-containing protein 5 isoform X2 [Varanus komodoensis]|uniref:ATPase family AAA domain-containing protein 5 isoform X2 n=1 Tax=Varanus komodoensis TaxID=61221 RepID=UPI001CF7A2C0|nr:ATPase family AAA domain-containing protein 5 isoform X2 [Varanus komodoensis]